MIHRTGSAQSYVMQSTGNNKNSSFTQYDYMSEVHSQILQQFPSATNIGAIKTVQRGKEQHYTTYGKFDYKKKNHTWEGRFEVETSYYNNTWRTNEIRVINNVSDIF